MRINLPRGTINRRELSRNSSASSSSTSWDDGLVLGLAIVVLLRGRRMGELVGALVSEFESAHNPTVVVGSVVVDQAEDGSFRSSTEDANTTSSQSSNWDMRLSATSGSGLGLAKPHKANNDAGWDAIRTVQAQARGGDDDSAGGAIGLNHFRLLQRLGRGDIGSVYLAQLHGLPDCFFALKVMDKKALSGRNKLLRAQTEREILEALDHPFLPTLYSHIDTQRFSCLVMEFCPGGDLHVLRQRQPSKRFSEAAARFYAAEVLLALEYLHMMGIVYRDLKPENVLVREDGHIMLSDFDLSLKCSVNPILLRLTSTTAGLRQPGGGSSSPSACAAASCVLPIGCVSPCSVHPIASCLPIPMPRMLTCASRHKAKMKVQQRRRLPELIVEPTDVRSMSFVGTHEYLAPEIILGDGHGSAVDWWTLGIFLYELLYGRTPFKGADNEATLTNVIMQRLQFPAASDPSASVQDLIAGLLIKDPQKRLGSIRGATEIKHHAFFQGVNWALIRCAVPPEIPSPYCPIPQSSPLIKCPVTSPKAPTTNPATATNSSSTTNTEEDQSNIKDWALEGGLPDSASDFEYF